MNWGDLWEYPFLASVWGTGSTVIGTVVTAGSAAVAAQVYRHSKRVDEYAQARQLRVYVSRMDGEFKVDMYNHSEHPIYAMQLHGTKRRVEEILGDPVVHEQYRQINRETDGKMHDDDRLAIIREWLEYNLHFSSFDDAYDFLLPSAQDASEISAVGKLALYYDYRIRFKDTRSLQWYFEVSRRVGEIVDTDPKPDFERRSISVWNFYRRGCNRFNKWKLTAVIDKSVGYAEAEVRRLERASES
ncbi:hypothetical protein [Rhodococcoides yunnanense]|uniref:Uncharacterized protein n=1 Tax=Rhodococcoides yunnanense TaxID=278209 RepID=A0ABU4BDI7_9NOCA|nr:hypothetical protein [Rhodococcus yunnanensis]MDV6262181.1 hypothetical protein [Rhodococcus yunnanensis]